MKIAKLLVWLFLTLPFLGTAQTSPTPVEAEKEAILAVITEQTRAYFERDFAAWKNTHVQADYYTEFKYWEGWDDPVRAVRGWAGHEANVTPRFAPDQPKSVWNAAQYERSDIHIRLAASGDMAWVTYSQRAVDPETKEIHGASYETRVMEKHDGQWKIAYLGYHYLPEAQRVSSN